MLSDTQTQLPSPNRPQSAKVEEIVVRVLLLVSTIIVVWFVPWVVWNVYDAKKTTEPITRVGGYVHYSADDAGITGGVAGARSVHFDGIGLADDDLRAIGPALEALPRIYLVSFMKTPISDAGLDHLTGLTQVRTIDLRFTRVTPEGVARLQKKLPKCNLNAYFPNEDNSDHDDSRKAD